jgi:hypothetical protein
VCARHGHLVSKIPNYSTGLAFQRVKDYASQTMRPRLCVPDPYAQGSCPEALASRKVAHREVYTEGSGTAKTMRPTLVPTNRTGSPGDWIQRLYMTRRPRRMRWHIILTSKGWETIKCLCSRSSGYCGKPTRLGKYALTRGSGNGEISNSTRWRLRSHRAAWRQSP